MINHKDIIQKSEAWHELKHGKIGGTLSKGLFTKGDTLFIDILSQRIDPFNAFDEDEAMGGYETGSMARGNDLEPLAGEYISEYTGLTFVDSGWLQSEQNELLGISPDGITEDETVSFEAKCPNRKKHTETLLNNEIPLDNINQCVHYFTVNSKLEKLYFISFRPESIRHFIKCLTLDSPVNMGTKAKPVIKKVSEWVKLAHENADLLLAKIIVTEENLKQTI